MVQCRRGKCYAFGNLVRCLSGRDMGPGNALRRRPVTEGREVDTTGKSEARGRFRGFVHMVMKDQRFLSRPEERRLMEEGVARFGLEADEARGIILAVADDNDFVLERELDRRIATVLERDAGKSRSIDRKRFDEAARLYVAKSNGAVSEAQARRNVKRVMEKEDLKPARSGLFASRRWFRRVEGPAEPALA